MHTSNGEPLGTWHKYRRGVTAPCPSLLLALRSALLPVNLPALLRSGSDRRAQLAAPCRGCGGPNGNSDIHPSACLFSLRSDHKKRPARICSDSRINCNLITSLCVFFIYFFGLFLLQSVHSRLTLKRKWNRSAACWSTGSVNGRRLRERAVAHFSLSLCLPPSHLSSAASTAAIGAVSAMAVGVKEALRLRRVWKICPYCGLQCLSQSATEPLFWSSSRVRCLTLPRTNNSSAAKKKIHTETSSGGWT